MPSNTFAGRYTNLAAIAEFVAQAAQEAGLNSKETYAVKLAVDEACTNIIEHSYGGESNSDILCSYEVIKDGLKITIQDWGKPFAPDEIPEPNFDVDLCDLEPRGAGLFFMKNMMDEVTFDFESGDGNILVMIKKRA
jgi:serine/threonine-protein kinase RsbW